MSPEIERLLADDDWIRRLARRLVRDPDAADDLVQDAWVAALSSGDAIRSPRSWFGGVLRNTWRDRRRRSERRGRWERAAAREEHTPPTDELVEEIALRQALFEGLRELQEPLRRTLVLRFLKGRSLKAIARQEGVAVSTVHERVERGLAKLRMHLDRRHKGDRRAWCLGLLSLANPPGSGGLALGSLAEAARVAQLPLGGVAVLNSTWKIIVPVLLVAGAVGAFQLRSEPRRDAEARAPRASRPELTKAPRSLAANPETEARREPAAAPASEVHAATNVVPPAVRRGRVVDPAGAPLPSLAVRFQADGDAESERRTVGAVTDVLGAFELSVAPEVEGAFELSDAVYRLVTHGAVDDEDLLVAAPVRRYGGVVVDGAGAPIEDARVEVRLRYSLYRELGLQRSLGTADGVWAQRTDAAGRFAFEDTVGGDFAVLFAAHDAFSETTMELPAHDAFDLVATLGRPGTAREIRGVVLAPSGAPVEGASVSLGRDIVETGADGAFALLWTPGRERDPGFEPREGGALGSAAARGYLTALHESFRPARVELSPALARDLVVLQLGAEPLSIAGRVRDPNGEPLEGILVWVQDPTSFGRVDYGQGEESALIEMTAEEAMRGGFNTRGVYTGEDGRFRIERLFDRRYRVQAIDPRTASVGRGWDVHAGDEAVELELARDPSATRVAGRVVSGRGEPLAEIELRANRDGFFDDYHAMPPKEGEPLVTDSDGRFAFEALAVEGTRLRLDGAGLLFYYVSLADRTEPLDDLVLVAPRTCELQVVLETDPGLADRLEVVDDEGEAVRILESFGSFLTDGTSGDIVNGKSGVLLVEEHGSTLVLYREDEEVLRRELRLDPGERTELRY